MLDNLVIGLEKVWYLLVAAFAWVWHVERQRGLTNSRVDKLETSHANAVKSIDETHAALRIIQEDIKTLLSRGGSHPNG